MEWATRIRLQVDAEFSRVATAFRSVALCQQGSKRSFTEAMIAILEDKRLEVMGHEQAGYFIHDWQEITDQVRQMIFHDKGYLAAKNANGAVPAERSS